MTTVRALAIGLFITAAAAAPRNGFHPAGGVPGAFLPANAEYELSVRGGSFMPAGRRRRDAPDAEAQPHFEEWKHTQYKYAVAREAPPTREDASTTSPLLTETLIASQRFAVEGLPAVVKASRRRTLLSLLSQMSIQDFGFDDERVAAVEREDGPDAAVAANGAGPIRVYTIYADKGVALCLFRLAPGAQIPLHSHPDMEVLCRVLFGSARYTSCDIDPTVVKTVGGKPLQRLTNVVDTEVTGPFTEEVGPHDGNVHEITATSENGMAFFDVITPPYRSKVPFYKCNVEGLVEEVSVDYYSGGFEKRMCDYRGARPDLAAVDAACRDKHELTEEEHQLVYAAKARNKRWRRYQL